MSVEPKQIDVLECTECGSRVYPNDACPECGTDVETVKVGIERKFEISRAIREPEDIDELCDQLRGFISSLQIMKHFGWELGPVRQGNVYWQHHSPDGVDNSQKELYLEHPEAIDDI